MAKFCGKCGSRLDEATGLCPNCDAKKIKELVEKPTEQPKEIEKKPEISQPKATPMSKKEARAKRKSDKKAAKKERKAQKTAAKKAKKKEKWKKLTPMQKVKRFLLKLFTVVFVLLLFVGGISAALVYFDLADIPLVNEAVVWLVKQGADANTPVGFENEVEEYKVDPIDAEAYFNENSSIISSVEVTKSNAVKTEAEAYKCLMSLGFSDYQITTDYLMDGTYCGSVNISEASNAQHPVYQTYYATANGEIWTIVLMGNVIMANPVSYNLQSTNSVSVIFSETESVMSYDSATNMYFETIPNEDALVVKVIESINADTLENMTIEVIDSYE